MPDTKISALTALTGANVAADDVFPIVDTSAVETKSITKTELDTASRRAPLLFATDNTHDIGASGATRPRSGFFGTALTVGDNGGSNGRLTIGIGLTAGLYFGNRGSLSAQGDGIFRCMDNAATGFDRVQFGGTTTSFPALKRSSAILQARLADDSGYTTMDALHRLQGAAPASATDTGTAGDIRYASGFVYICVAANTWQRAALTTW